MGITDRLPSEEVVTEFVTLLRSGNSVRTACEYTGLATSSVYQWLAEAERDDSRPWATDFADQTKKARSFAQAASLRIVQQAARDGTWQAAAWFLERSRPQEWALHHRHEMDVRVEHRVVNVRDQLASALDAMGHDLIEGVILDAEPEGAPGPAALPAAPGAPREAVRRAG